jgi:pyruvate/2-oxoglutarate dehydrogenase complex dihydrolipoamide acyltransferase (E2) component
MKHYAVIGRGDGNRKVITASLADLPAQSIFYVLWTGDSTPAEEAVLDWLIDHEQPFNVYSTVRVPPGLARYAQTIVEGNLPAMLTAVADMGGSTALVLWDEGIDQDVIEASTILPHLLELTNGLTPIEVQGDDEEEVPAPVAVPAEAPTAPAPVLTAVPALPETETSDFSPEELENMPAAAVKRIAKERGMEITGMTKSEIIDSLRVAKVSPPMAPLPTPAHNGDAESHLLDLARQVQEVERQINDFYDGLINPLAEKRAALVGEICQILGFDL